MKLKRVLKNLKQQLTGKKSSSSFKLSRPLNIGIIGAGNQASNLSGQVISSGAKIVAIHDIKIESAQKLAKLTNTSFSTNNLEEFFNVPMDGLIISTIPTVRSEPIKLACKKKINLLIEKPPAFDLNVGRECLKYIKESGVITSVGFQSRYDPGYEKLKKLIKGKEIHLVKTMVANNYYDPSYEKLKKLIKGKEIHLVKTMLANNYYPLIQVPEWYLQKKHSGGPYAEQAIHLLDCVRFVLDDPKALRASSMGVKNMVNFRKDLDAENVLQLIYELDNGVYGSHINHCGHGERRWDFELIGPNLQLQANATEQIIKGKIDGRKIKEKFSHNNDLGGHDKVTAWLKTIETNDKKYIRSSYEESLNTQALVDAAIKSQISKKMEQVEKV